MKAPNFIDMEKTIIVLVLSILILASAGSVLAAGLVPCGGYGEPRCQLCHFFVMGQNIVAFFLFSFVPPVAVLLVVIAGAMFILGSGYDPSMINQARSMLQSIAIGLVLIYGSWVLVNTFFVLIGLANSNLGNSIRDWFQINCAI